MLNKILLTETIQTSGWGHFQERLWHQIRCCRHQNC